MTKELLSSMTYALRERIRNPFLVAFAISWFVLNWRSFLIVIWSDKPIEERIDWVNRFGIFSWVYSLLLPLLFASLYSLAMPWILNIISYVQIRAIEKIKTRRWQSSLRIAEDRLKVIKLETEADLHRARQEMEIECQKINSEQNHLLSIANDRVHVLESVKKENETLKYKLFELQQNHSMEKTRAESLNRFLQQKEEEIGRLNQQLMQK